MDNPNQPPQRPNLEVQRVDRPELAETYVDSLGLCSFEGAAVRVELCVTRLQPAPQGANPRASRYPAARLVLAPTAAIELFNTLQGMMAAMEKSGLVKRTEPAAAPKT